uniref:purine-nucleoside phosphorylase n=1 Tax=Gasterosteus aculeatus TaxID=69293 RepID=G3Q0L3_GASAC
SYDECRKTADWLLSKTRARPTVRIVCGSGLGGLAEALEAKEVFKYSDIPNFPQSTAVPGHAGQLVFGTLKGKPCVCMQGRFHLYEGYSVQTVRAGLRNFKISSASTPSDVNQPLMGQRINLRDREMINEVENIIHFKHKTGLSHWFKWYFMMYFPLLFYQYESNLEARSNFNGILLETRCSVHTRFLLISRLIQESVPLLETFAFATVCHISNPLPSGMSTAHEVIVARHAGMRCLALSLITNISVMDYDSREKANHEEVLETGRQRAGQMEKLVSTIVSRM